MYNNIVKVAKNIIAKNEAKKLLEYFKNEASNGLTNDQIQLLKQKITNIQKQSFNFPWFVHRFIQQKKHYQDVQDLLKVTKAYSKLNKELRTFKFEDNKSFSDFYKFMQKYLNKNAKNNQFKKPSYCKLIHSDGKYNYYYADAKDEKCYQDLHQCNTKADGHQYAMWCVVTGTVSWGRYTDAEFPFYIYVTDKKNTPYMLFNFGYDYDAQIKDIHDNAFCKYTQQITKSINTIAEKYNFNLEDDRIEGDYTLLTEISDLYKTKTIQNIIEYFKSTVKNNKYAKYQGKSNIDYVIDLQSKQLAYIFHNEDQMNFNNHSFNDQYLWKLLLKSDDIYNACFILKRGDITQKTMDFALTWFFKNDQDQPIKELLKDKKIKEIDKNQIDLLMNFESYKVLALLINNNFINIIQNQNILNAFYTQPRAVQGLTQLIENDVIKWNDDLLQLFVKTEKFFLLVRLIKDKKIQFSYKILDVLIENNRALQLRDILLTNRFIYGCQAIINFLIDHNYLAVLNNIYDHFHLDSDAQLFQNIFVEKDSLNNLKYLLFNREVKLNNNTLDYLIKKGEDLFVYNNILMFQDIEERIEDVNHFVQLLKQYKKSDALYSCIRNNNLDCTNDIIQFFINQKKQLIIYNLIEKKEIQVNQTLLKKFVDKQLLNLLVKLFFQHIIYADKEKDVLEYLINNKNKLSPMTKLKFEQFLRSEELDY